MSGHQQEPWGPDGGLRTYLNALFGLDPFAFVEIAHRRECDGRKGPMHRGRTGIFLPARDLEAIAVEIERLGHSEHVWVGVVPRHRHPKTGELGGTKAHAAPARVVWVDCDDEDGTAFIARIERFRARPHMLVASGGGHHAYWLLRDPIDDPRRLREANRVLAEALGGDPQAVDAARILRPPGTRNFKTEYEGPRAVELVRADRHPRFCLEDVVGPLPRRHASGHKPQVARVRRTVDRLQWIAPALYFRELAGVEPDRGGKVCCPLPDHDDPEPSCHVYENAAQGWYCYGCGRGGDIYELAGALWSLRRDGWEFVELRRLLQRRFGIAGDERPDRADRRQVR